MFNRAVHQPSPVPAKKQPSLSQTLFPSSSPLAKQDAYQAINVLKPSASSVMNGAGIAKTNGASNLLKVPASQAKGLKDALRTYGSLHDPYRYSTTVPSQDLPAGSGKVESLHEAVYFDENDFDDDADLDLEEGGLMQNRPTLAREENVLSGLPETPSPAKNYPASSAPLAWSSSPLQHKRTPPNASLLRRTNGTDVVDLTQPTTTVETDVDPNPRPSKRRTLPWLGNGDDAAAPEPHSCLPAHVQRIVDRNRAKKAEALQENGKFTPLPKNKQSFQHPWNKTASAMKEEQKKLRQANKKLVRNNDASDESLKLAISAKKRKKLESVFLSEEQQRVLKFVVEEGKSVFFTGSAGTGKSVLMREIIANLRKKHAREPDRVAVTASTGLAACNVGGVTLHSFGGIGLGKESVPELVRKIKRNPKAKNRWMRTKILVVDEISMVDGDLFDKLEAIARNIRNNGRPFGGIQLVITGDFFQLPPVPDYGKTSKFAFDAATWNTSIEHTIGLTQVFRQRDPVFANMLNEMRLGNLSQKSISIFKSLSRPLHFKDDVKETELFPTRGEVDYANNMRMKNLAGTGKPFKAFDGGAIADLAQRERLLSNCMAPPLIELKKGAQVMLIKNIDETLVNGSLGTVMAFMDEKTFDIYHEDEEEFQAAESMDVNHEDMSQPRKKLKALLNKDLVADTAGRWPLVRFAMSDGTSRDLLCQPEMWKIELPNGEVQASRSQIPLILAWALSIHKAQGQTLERVKVDLGKIFEKGQAYVALSRATCQEGLQILRFDPKKVMAHDKVRSFYNSLYSAEQALIPKPAVGSARYGANSAKAYENNFLSNGDSAGMTSRNSAFDGDEFTDEELLMAAYA